MDRETAVLAMLDIAEKTQGNPEAFAEAIRQLQAMMGQEEESSEQSVEPSPFR